MTAIESPEAGFASDLWVIELAKIQRFRGLNMIHRTDDFVHARRVMWLSRVLVNMLEELPDSPHHPDIRRVSMLGYHHDDPEILTGDYLAHIKRAMSSEELKQLETDENAASFALAHFVFGLNPPLDQTYVDQILEFREQKTLESQIVEIADKWDPVGEILHDIRCGNQEFAKLLPFSQNRFAEFSHKYPIFNILKDHPKSPFDNIPSPEEVVLLPTIGLSDFQSMSDVERLMEWEAAAGWPLIYRAWAEISNTIFWRGKEKYLFPGWYIDLWKKFNIYPSSTTVSGLWLSR